jgi:two-component system, chemotaxis family, chemotaxis protein CheY
MKLMIVDDSAVVKTMIESFLKPLGMEIVGTASNGLQALKVFEDKKPDIVTLDITMPELDGLTCLEAMMRRRPDTKVLVISALKDHETGIRALKLGAKSFITKPFTADQIREEFIRVAGM